MGKAVFLDRDGVINEEVDHLIDVDDIRILPDVPEAIRRLNEKGFKTVIITNQAAVARGMITEAEMREINERIIALLEVEGAKIDATYYCPHHPDFTGPCECRKPKPGMVQKAAADLDIDLKASFLIGDAKRDIDAGKAAGCRTILVLTGYGKRDVNVAEPDYVKGDLAEAVKLIVEELDK